MIQKSVPYHRFWKQQVLVRQPYIGILGNEMLINESSRSIIYVFMLEKKILSSHMCIVFYHDVLLTS